MAITCCDSRCSPEVIFNARPGELFVARNPTGLLTPYPPDGGTRVIGFYDGKPAGANSRGEFRFTREGDLNMIRVGVSERFEITDALAFGD